MSIRLTARSRIIHGFSSEKSPLPSAAAEGIAKFEPLALFQSTYVQLSGYSYKKITITEFPMSQMNEVLAHLGAGKARFRIILKN